MCWAPSLVCPVVWSVILRTPEKQVIQKFSHVFDSGLIEMGLMGCQRWGLWDAIAKVHPESLGRGREELISRWEDMLSGKPEQLKAAQQWREGCSEVLRGDGHPGIIKNLRYACTQIHVLMGCTVAS